MLVKCIGYGLIGHDFYVNAYTFKEQHLKDYLKFLEKKSSEGSEDYLLQLEIKSLKDKIKNKNFFDFENILHYEYTNFDFEAICMIPCSSLDDWVSCDNIIDLQEYIHIQNCHAFHTNNPIYPYVTYNAVSGKKLEKDKLNTFLKLKYKLHGHYQEPRKAIKSIADKLARNMGYTSYEEAANDICPIVPKPIYWQNEFFNFVNQDLVRTFKPITMVYHLRS